MKILYFDLEHGSQTLGSEKHIAEMFETSYDDQRAILGQKSLNIIFQD